MTWNPGLVSGLSALGLLCFSLGCSQSEEYELKAARPNDPTTRIAVIPSYGNSQQAFLPILITPDLNDSAAKLAGYPIICTNSDERNAFFASIGEQRRFEEMTPLYNDPDQMPPWIAALNLAEQPSLLCASDRLKPGAESPDLIQDENNPDRYYFRFSRSSQLQQRSTIYELGCEGLVTGLGLDLTAALSLDIASEKRSGTVQRDITLNCPKGKEFFVPPFIKECTAAVQAADPSPEELSYLQLLESRNLGPQDCPALYRTLSGLKELDLSDQNLTQIEALRHFPRLENLQLAYNDITNLTALQTLVNLKNLDLRSNLNLTTLDGLQGATKILTLDIADTAVTDLSALAQAARLTTLDLSENPYLTLDALDVLKSTKVRAPVLQNTPLVWQSDRQTFFTNCMFFGLMPTEAGASYKAMLNALGFPYRDDSKSFSFSCDIIHRNVGAKTALDLGPHKQVSSGCLDPEVVSTLHEFPKLSLSLDYSACGLSSGLEHLAKLPNLSSLNLSQNSLQDLRPLLDWKSLSRVKLQLDGNPVSASACPSDTSNADLNKFCDIHQNPFVSACSLGDQGPAWTFYQGLFRVLRVREGACPELFQVSQTVKNLDLSQQQIESIRPVLYLTNLETLDLARNRISDLSPLAGLPKLTRLDISENQVRDLSQLPGWLSFANLKLQLNGNPVTLDKCPLPSANADLNQFCSSLLNPFVKECLKGSASQSWSTLQALYKTLGITQGACSELYEKASQQSGLTLSSMNISEASILQYLTQLKELKIDHNALTDLSFIAGLSQLHTLDISSNQITEMETVSRLRNLTALDVSFNPIRSMAPLGNLSSLRKLDAAGLDLASCSFVKGLTQLTSLSFYYNSLRSLDCVKGLTNLESLSASDNDLTEIEVLSELTQLKFLWLSENKIVSLSPLKSMTEFVILDVSSNRITNLTPIAHVKYVLDLRVNDNPVPRTTSACPTQSANHHLNVFCKEWLKGP